MARASTATRLPSKRVLEAISEGLEEIEAYVVFPGSAIGKGQPVTDESSPKGGEVGADTPEDESTDEQYDDDDYGGNDGFDREEIEVAIDAFLSALLSAEVIRKTAPGKTPSFTDVFRRFFGKDHEVTAKAQSFEEYVTGYFGWISPEDMRSAHSEFSEIQEIVQKALKDKSDAE